MKHFYDTIPGWFRKSHVIEFSKIINTIQDNATWVEIGSFKGKSLSFSVVESINQNKKINFFAVDTWADDITGNQMAKDLDVLNGTLYESFLTHTTPILEYFTPIRMKSVDASKKFKNNSIDVLYIDAGHDFNSVTEDWKTWLPKMKPSSIIIFDDCVKDNTWGVWESVIDCASFLKVVPIYNKPIAIIKLN